MAVASGLTPLLRAFANRFGLLDAAVGSRKIHGKPIPRLGGVAIVVSFYIPIAALLLYGTGMGFRLFENRARTFGLLGGGLVIAALGLIDDLRGAGALLKFTVQFAVAFALYQVGFRIEHIATPFGATVDLGLFSLPFTMLWMVGVVNAMNLIDGLDGLAGGVALFALGTTLAVAFFRGDVVMVLFSATLAGSVLGFLFYNFNPASIFMGDTGSMFLGFVLAASSIWTNQKSSTAVAILVPLVALGLPIADTLFAILRRAWRGRPLFSADKEHIHHRLLALGLTQRQAVIVLYAFCIVLASAALLLSFANSVETAAVLSLLSLVGFFALRRLGFLGAQKGTLRAPGDERRKNREVRAAVRGIAAELRRAASVAVAWDAVKPLCALVLARDLSLALRGPHLNGERVTTLFQTDFTPSGRAVFVAKFGVGDEHGQLDLTWDDGRTEIDRDHEIAVEVLCDHLAEALARISPREVASAPMPSNVLALRGKKQ